MLTLPENLPAVLVEVLEDGTMSSTATDDIALWAATNGAQLFPNTNHRLRPELQAFPKIDGYVGPANGGLNEQGQMIARYETPAVCSAMSQ